jgi:hypothetical protein
VTERAVETAVLGGVEHLSAALRELALELLHRAVLPGGLVEPVERERDGDDEQADETEGEGAVELRALELLVVEVGLAVRRQLDLGSDLGLALPDVDPRVGERDDDRGEEDDAPDRGLGAGQQHQ